MRKEELDKILIIIADEWKYRFYKLLLSLINETKNQGEILKTLMQKDYLKPHSKFINQIIPKVLKNVGKYPKVTLTTNEEYKFFQDIKSMIMKKYKCKLKEVSATRMIQILEDLKKRCSETEQGVPEHLEKMLKQAKEEQKMNNKNMICGFNCALEGAMYCMDDCPNALKYKYKIYGEIYGCKKQMVL